MTSQAITLLDRLHKKRLTDSSVVIEGIVVPDSPSLQNQA